MGSYWQSVVQRHLLEGFSCQYRIGRESCSRAVKISIIDRCPLPQCWDEPREGSRESGCAKLRRKITQKLEGICRPDWTTQVLSVKTCYEYIYRRRYTTTCVNTGSPGSSKATY